MNPRLLLAVATFLASSPAFADDYYFRARPLTIEAPGSAPTLPDGAFQSGPDVLHPLRVANGWHALPAGTYRALRPVAEIVAVLRAAGGAPLRIQFHPRGQRHFVCYVPASSLAPCVAEVLRAGADARATATERDGYLYAVTPAGFSVLDRDPEVRASLAALGLHRVLPPEEVGRP